MTILELVKQLDTVTQDYKRQVRDLPKSYVRGTDVFREAVARTKANYETSKEGILEQINKELVKNESKAMIRFFTANFKSNSPVAAITSLITAN